jgi:hypothetical protein
MGEVSTFSGKERRTVKYFEIEFVRSDVLAVWPSPQAKSATPRAPQSNGGASEAAKQAVAAPTETVHKTRAAYRNELRSYLAVREPRDLGATGEGCDHRRIHCTLP